MGRYDSDIHTLAAFGKDELLWALREKCEGIKNNTLLIDLVDTIARKRLAAAEAEYEANADRFFDARKKNSEWLNRMTEKYGKASTRFMTQQEREEGEAIRKASVIAQQDMMRASKEKKEMLKIVSRKEF